MILVLVGAWAQDASETGRVVFHDDVDPYGGLAIDSGWQPNSDAVLAVRFQVFPTGGVLTELEAESELTWTGEGFEQRLVPVAGSGLFGIDTALNVDFDVSVDVTVWSGTLDVWDTSLAVLDVAGFDSLLLPDSAVDEVAVVVDDVGTFQPFSTTIGIIPTVNLEVAVDVVPELTSVFAGRRIVATLEDEVQELFGEDGVAWFPLPAEPVPGIDLTSTYEGDLTTLFDLVIVPSLTLDSPVGDWELASFDLPIPILDFQSERTLEPQVVHHSLPSMTPVTVGALGLVQVGRRANLTVPIESIGELALEGVARIEGSDGFSVYPGYFSATGGNTTGLVVTFAPEEEGDAAATLVLETNDPSAGYVRIPLSGAGWSPEIFPEPVEEPEARRVPAEDVRVCGCASTTGPSWTTGMLLGLLALVRRR